MFQQEIDQVTSIGCKQTLADFVYCFKIGKVSLKLSSSKK